MWLVKQSGAANRPSYMPINDDKRTMSRGALRTSRVQPVVCTTFGSYRGCLVAVKMLHSGHLNVEVRN